MPRAVTTWARRLDPIVDTRVDIVETQALPACKLPTRLNMEPGLIFRQVDGGAVRLCRGMGSVSSGSKITRSLPKVSHLLYSKR